MQDQSDRQAFDDLLDFDDDELFGEKTNAMRSSNNISKRSRHAKPKGRGLMLAFVTLLTILSAGAGYQFYTSQYASKDVSIDMSRDMWVATLNTMPRPTQAVTTTSSKDNALEQLNYMTNMAPLLTQAYSIDSTDPELLNTIQQTEESLVLLAKTWNASRYPDIASQIEAVSNAMPAAVHDQSRVQGILVASEQVMGYDQIITLLDNKHYLRPSGNSVLDKISTINVNEYRKLKGTSKWQQMMKELSQKAMEKLANSEFDDVAKLTEAALSLDADHTGFNTLKLYLAGS